MNPDNDREESILIKTERAAENAVNKALSERWARVRWLVAAVASLAAALGYASVPQWLSREVSNQVGKEVERHKGTVEQLHTELEGVRGQLREVREKIQAELDATQRHVDLIGKVMRQQVERDRDDFGAKVQSDFRVVAEDSRRVQDLARQANEDARKAVTAAQGAARIAADRVKVINKPLKEKLRVLEQLHLDTANGELEYDVALAILILRDLVEVGSDTRAQIHADALRILRHLARTNLRAEQFQEVRGLVRKAAVELRLFELLREQASSPRSWERTLWILCLGALEDEKALETLLPIVEAPDQDVEMRVASLRSLSEIVFGRTLQSVPSASIAPPELRDEEILECRRRPVTYPRRPTQAAIDEVVQVTASRLAEDHSAIRSAALKALRHMWTPTLSDKVERDALVRVEEAARRAVSSDAKGDLEEALMVFARTRSRLGTERLKSLVLDQDLPDGVRLAAVQKMGLGLTPADETVRALQGLEADEHLKQDLRQAATTQRTQLEQRRARTN